MACPRAGFLQQAVQDPGGVRIPVTTLQSYYSSTIYYICNSTFIGSNRVQCIDTTRTHTHIYIYIQYMYIYEVYFLQSKKQLARSGKADLSCHVALPLLKSVWHTPGPKCPNEIMNWVSRIVRNHKSTFAIPLATQGGKQKRSIAPDQTEWLEISPSCLEEQELRRVNTKSVEKAFHVQRVYIE